MESAILGLILDTSLLIAGERGGRTPENLLEGWAAAFGSTNIALSAITVVELTHGVYRAKTPEQLARRLSFMDDMLAGLPIYPLTGEVAKLAGRISGEQVGRGIQLGLADLLVGATAIFLGYGVATLNRKDFARIPGLSIVDLPA